MSGEITLDIALQRVESSSIKERAEGLKDLKHVLRNNSKFDTLSDVAFHRIYEVLFGVTVTEKSTYLKSKTVTTRSAAESRLSACASALRLAVEVGVRFIRAKTVRSVLDHVIETVTLPNASFCEPIALDYVKCLKALFTYQPHVEHLSRDDRERTAAFCVECIKIARSGSDSDDAQLGAEPILTNGITHGLSHRSSRSHVNNSVGSQGARSLAKSMTEETISCLSLTTAAPNAAPGTGASELLSAVVGVLQGGFVAGASRQDAFAAINNILARVTTEDIQLTQRTIGPLIRLIRTYWSAKTSFDKALSAFRNEMLITLIHIRPYLFAGMFHDNDIALRSELSGLADALKNEYSRRSERDQLRLDDIRLRVSDPDFTVNGEIGTILFRLRSTKGQAEACWTILDLLANLSSASLESNVAENSSDDEDDVITQRPRKRPRMTEEFDEMLIASGGGALTARICALQTLAFLAQQRHFGSKELAKAVEKLATSCADDNGTIASWAMLALASVASQVGSTKTSLSNRWHSVWQIVVRALSNVATCRAASHLIIVMIKARLISQQMEADLIQTMASSMDLNGPTVLADSVLTLLDVTIKAAQQMNPVLSTSTAENVLSWLFRNFRPSRFADRDYGSLQSLMEPQDVIRLVDSCLGQDSHCQYSYQYPTWDVVGQIWVESANQLPLLKYLLLVPEAPRVANSGIRGGPPASATSQSRPSCEIMTLNYLSSETQTAREHWTELVREKAHGVSTEAFAAYCNSCLVVTCLAHCSSFRDSRRQRQLQSQALDLLRALGDFVQTQSCSPEKVDTMLTVFSSICGGFIQANRLIQHPDCELPICRTVSRTMAARSNARYVTTMDDEEDDMDVADESQNSRESAPINESQSLKSEYAVNFSLAALRASVITYATTIMALNESSESIERGYDAVSAKIVDYVLSLPEKSFVLSRSVISSMPDIGVELTVDDCYRLFDHCADRILWPYLYERNEVALISVLEIMSTFAAVLTDEHNRTLYDLGIDIYNWYAGVALNAGVLSPAVQERVACLLLRLCQIDTNYGRDDKQDIPSVRTSLFKLVELGTIRTKFNLANRVSNVFGLFVLSNHPVMFDDLLMSLPDDIESLEGMAMRLLFLSKLGSAWHSLLRQCVYYIFETAGRVKSSGKHAAQSMTELSVALNFDTPQRLFQLFAPQLLHTWLQRSKIKSLPFEVFNYDTLENLILQNQGEITAQLIGHGDEAALQVVMDASRSSSKELVARNFAKCEAYCLGWDIVTSSAGSGEASSESRLRKLMESKEEHRTFVTGYFPAIMGHLFLCLQQDDPQDSWLEKRSGFGQAAASLSEMRAFSHSDRTLPLSQEPSFKNKYLCDEIERLCRRTGSDPFCPWEPCSFALAARMLLDSIEHALGPLHTCLVIRKLRLLICMAGDVALSGFPLELLVHTLRPFLADSQCADDVIGVLQYLLRHGQDYLQTDIPFLTGTVALMILQMRKHSGATLDSTTQESQHRSTVQKMEKFQSWLVDLLKSCQSTSSTKMDTSIANTLSSISLPGNARKGSPESLLLLHFLDEETTRSEALREPDRKEVLMLLSENFELPTSISDDCLGSDVDCARLTGSLFNVIQVSELGETFKEWAAYALGRAYACTGIRPLMHSSTDYHQSNQRSRKHEGIARSQRTIATNLSESLFSRDRAQAGLADYTLRSVFMTFKDHEEVIAFQEMLPSFVVEALSSGTHGYEPSFATEMAVPTVSLRKLLEPDPETSLEFWTKSLSLALCRDSSHMAILPALTVALQKSASLALKFLPCIIHILLVKQLEGQLVLRMDLSNSLAAHFGEKNTLLLPKQRFLVELLLYLREQSVPGEITDADRLRWLEVDWLLAAQAAQRCGMSTAALMFVESSSSLSAQGNRRASSRSSLTQVSIAQVPQDLLLSIFRNLEESDSFYGVEQPATLESVLDRLDYEADGYKSLMFRAAQMDTQLRSNHQVSAADNAGMIRSLSMLSLNSLTFALLTGGIGSAASAEDLLNTARDLQRWDIVPMNEGLETASNSFTAYQELSRSVDRQTVQQNIRTLIHGHINSFVGRDRPGRLSHDWFSTLASFTEINEVLACNGPDALQSRWTQMEQRQSWMSRGRYEEYQLLLTNRHTLFSVLAKKDSLLLQMHIGAKDCRAVEIKALLDISTFARQHDQLQRALAASNQCTFLIEHNTVPITAEVATRVETASVLWNMGEVAPSIRMLQAAYALSNVEGQDIPIGQAGLLAQLAHQLAEARLEKPDEILSKYLEPAISQLAGQSAGHEAGKVFHEFATFCDKQLQNPNNIEDFNRIAKLRQRKLEELEGLQKLSRSSARGDKEEHLRSMNKAKQWYDIDNTDYERLKSSRDTFLEQSMQNYLLALAASDDYDISILRFFTLWLEHTDVANANMIVSKHLPQVPSWKFVLLVNQLMSRLQLDDSAFQASLKSLITRLCSEHPYHSLHQLFAATRKPNSRDEAAISRYNVANGIRQRIMQKSNTGKVLENVFMADRYYQAFANRELEKGAASRIPVKDVQEAHSLVKKIPTLHVPPATMSIPLRPDGTYSGLPEITGFSNVISLMAGISRPKKLTALASNGQHYAQLFKGPPGKDDLRQDAIMEQVFGEVSKMLQNHETTRQRNLHVRTYKVIPLSTTTGIIEFVPNSMSLTDFLVPAHERYHPQDYKNKTARERISNVQQHPIDARIKEYQKVCDHLHPVLRHFFFERFKDPDEWFEKRTAYTRTTATISILGYVLGLGDRHCQNIMLDEKSGEVVHIDLGVAFEAGRVLPVPELVPFRLSRDVIDGMGITKVEGVFRRCCEFTMDALRDDKDSIMTLLNVLRYDPLYTWTVSPLRAKRMQEATGRTMDGTEAVEGSSKKREQEAGEADRALSIVEKKLSKSLSTAATVNELIQQATDVRNLATLFSGWAAYY